MATVAIRHAQAWRTVTHALAQVPIGAPETIHLAPGTYAPATGEVFPWDIPPEFAVQGDAGAAATWVDAQTTGDVVTFRSSAAGNPWTLPPTTALRGLTLRYGLTGVRIFSDVAHVAPTLEDLVVWAPGAAGISVHTKGAGAASAAPKLRRVEVRFTGAPAIDVDAGARGVTLEVSDCVVRSAPYGLHVRVRTTAAVVLERSTLRYNGVGIQVFHGPGVPSSLDLTVRDTLITGTGLGFAASSNSALVQSKVLLERCTIAGNSVGVRGYGASAPQPPAIRLSSSIVAGNLDDLFLAGVGPVLASHSCIGDGDFAGQNGNFQADPGFVDPLGGDWRLAWGSPCIEAGDPATPAGMRDLAGNARPIDGDLDTVELPDCGALEFAPLFARRTQQIGKPLELELWGPPGANATLHFARAFPVASPFATPFGEFDLDRSFAVPIAQLSAAPGPPGLFAKLLPFDPGLVGVGLSFQALMSSAAAPAGCAFSNPVAVVPGF